MFGHVKIETIFKNKENIFPFLSKNAEISDKKFRFLHLGSQKLNDFQDYGCTKTITL